MLKDLNLFTESHIYVTNFGGSWERKELQQYAVLFNYVLLKLKYLLFFNYLFIQLLFLRAIKYYFDPHTEKCGRPQTSMLYIKSLWIRNLWSFD